MKINKIFLVSLFGLTIVVFSIVLFYVFYKSLDKYNDTRLDPLQISKNKIDSNKNYNLVLLGDSHAQYWRIDKPNQLNLGINGQTSIQIKQRYELCKKEVKGGDILIISVGANDVKSVSTNPDSKDEIVRNCLDNISNLIRSNKQKFNKIYIITIPPDFDVSFPYNVLNYEATLEAKTEINYGIRKISKNENIELIDAFEILKDKLGKEYSADGVHMNEKAYKILNKSID